MHLSKTSAHSSLERNARILFNHFLEMEKMTTAFENASPIFEEISWKEGKSSQR